MNVEATIDAPETIEAGYEAVKNLIFHQVHKFFDRYGGDWDELVGEANLAFVRGHNQYTTGHSATGIPITEPYHVVIRRWVWFELFDAMRARCRSKTVLQTAELRDEAVAVDAPTNDFMDDLSEDAHLAVMLVLEPPREIERVAQAKGGEPRNYRSTVRAYLQNTHGWKEERVNAAFAEIKEAL